MKSLHEIYEGIFDDDFGDKLEEDVLKDTILNAKTLPPVSSCFNSLAADLDKDFGTDYVDTYDKWKVGDVKKMISIAYSEKGPWSLMFSAGGMGMYQVAFNYRMGSKTDGWVRFSKGSMRIDAFMDLSNSETWEPGCNSNRFVKHWMWTKKYKWLTDWIVKTWREQK